MNTATLNLIDRAKQPAPEDCPERNPYVARTELVDQLCRSTVTRILNELSAR